MSRMVSEFLASRVRRVSLPRCSRVCVGRGRCRFLWIHPFCLLTLTVQLRLLTSACNPYPPGAQVLPRAS